LAADALSFVPVSEVGGGDNDDVDVGRPSRGEEFNDIVRIRRTCGVLQIHGGLFYV
jgi:hypothetical protein